MTAREGQCDAVLQAELRGIRRPRLGIVAKIECRLVGVDLDTLDGAALEPVPKPQ